MDTVAAVLDATWEAISGAALVVASWAWTNLTVVLQIASTGLAGAALWLNLQDRRRARIPVFGVSSASFAVRKHQGRTVGTQHSQAILVCVGEASAVDVEVSVRLASDRWQGKLADACLGTWASFTIGALAPGDSVEAERLGTEWLHRVARQSVTFDSPEAAEAERATSQNLSSLELHIALSFSDYLRQRTWTEHHVLRGSGKITSSSTTSGAPAGGKRIQIDGLDFSGLVDPTRPVDIGALGLVRGGQ